MQTGARNEKQMHPEIGDFISHAEVNFVEK
jgi:hypothetical protein